MTNPPSLIDDCFLHDKDRLRHDEALDLLRQRLAPIVGSQVISAHAALGRVLAEDILAPHEVPLHTNSAVDGYAFNSADFTGNITTNMTQSTSLVITSVDSQDMRKAVRYVKVQSIHNGQLSKESATSQQWKTTGKEKSCNLDSQYLDCSALDPMEWDCFPCPTGGSCTGSIFFEEVDAMFGWSKCANVEKKTFSQCMFARKDVPLESDLHDGIVLCFAHYSPN